MKNPKFHVERQTGPMTPEKLKPFQGKRVEYQISGEDKNAPYTNRATVTHVADDGAITLGNIDGADEGHEEVVTFDQLLSIGEVPEDSDD